MNDLLSDFAPVYAGRRDDDEVDDDHEYTPTFVGSGVCMCGGAENRHSWDSRNFDDAWAAKKAEAARRPQREYVAVALQTHEL